MLNYDEFKEHAEKDFKEMYPEKYGYTVSIIDINKINKNKEAFIIRTGDENRLLPSIYIEDMYNDYIKVGSYEEVIKNYVESIKRNETSVNELMPNKDTIKDRVVFQLINTKQNEEMLKNIPHREYMDLSVVYRIVTKNDKDGVSSGIISLMKINFMSLQKKILTGYFR